MSAAPWIAVALFGIMCAGAGETTRDSKSAKSVESVMPIDDVPEAARRALKKAAQNHPIALVTRKTTPNRVTYETTVVVGATSFFIKASQDGKILERKRTDR